MDGRTPACSLDWFFCTKAIPAEEIESAIRGKSKGKK